MKLSEIKPLLRSAKDLQFVLPDGTNVPRHFHITEVGHVEKTFIDCGGTLRKERAINFQLFWSTDYQHRLEAEKLLSIIELSEEALSLEDLEIEVEYQMDTIGKYGLSFNGTSFLLVPKHTDCLAKDKCEIPQEKPRIRLSELKSLQGEVCSPTPGCC